MGLCHLQLPRDHGCCYGTDCQLPRQSAFLVLPDNTNKLCHRCGKLGCAPNFCPLKQPEVEVALATLCKTQRTI
ncbi:hypothetical protein RIR_jg30805.t1 [Rhizophagus irregularis DAOM 181602=DAOM 197198]|nr:hypothetical protein RIR_jg30805.t1 [Rhizophagus irregularis DAOM 181602=DAOM 197198]